VIFPFLIYFGNEGIGATQEKKLTVTAISIAVAAIGVYACVGLYQMFFIELRRKFIVSKVMPLGKRYYLTGYYFKKAEFDGDEVVTIDEYHVKKSFGRNIATLLAKAPQTKTPNYRVVLKGGREYYLPAEIRDVDGLVRELGSYSRQSLQ